MSPRRVGLIGFTAFGHRYVSSKALNLAIIGVCVASAYVMRCVVYVCIDFHSCSGVTYCRFTSAVIQKGGLVLPNPYLWRVARSHALLGIVLTSYTTLNRRPLPGAKRAVLYFEVMLRDNNQSFDYPRAKLRTVSGEGLSAQSAGF